MEQDINFDFDKFGIDADDIKQEAEKQAKQGQPNISNNLKTVLETRQKLKEIKASEIKFAEPVLRQGENAVIFPHTINVIQGKQGFTKAGWQKIFVLHF